MALIKCPECNHDVSTQANTCPNCGYSIREMIEKAKEYYQEASGVEVGKKIYLIMKANDIPCTEFPYSMQANSYDGITKHKMNYEWITNNFNEIQKITLNHIKLISDNAESDYKYFQDVIERRKKYIERKSQSNSETEVLSGENYSKKKSYYETKIASKTLKEYYQEASIKFEFGKKIYLVMKANDIPCTEFPYSMQVSPSSDEWELHEMNYEWFKKNFNEIKEITLDNIELLSDNAESDYKHFQRLIRVREKIESKLQKSNMERIEQANEIASKILTETFPQCKCPHCGSSNITNISTAKRLVSTTLLGLASSTIGKTKECKSCGYKW